VHNTWLGTRRPCPRRPHPDAAPAFLHAGSGQVLGSAEPRTRHQGAPQPSAGGGTGAHGCCPAVRGGCWRWAQRCRDAVLQLLRSHRRPSAVSCALCYATVIRWRLRAARLRAARLRVAQLLRAGWRSRAAPEPERRRLARGGGAQGKPRRRVIGTTAPVPAIPPPSPRRSTPPALHPARPHARAA
jgi:hypothetical protein